MRAILSALAGGDGLKARAVRGSALTFLAFGGTQALRLASNLILTRLLVPEAFGLMALVNIFLIGLEMFSDLGINTAIIQNRRGDEPGFLNTAWTIQIGRGVLLFAATCALGVPAAAFYGQPELQLLLPAAGINALLMGFASTRMATANRHLMLGRITALELGAQAAGIVAMVGLALWWASVWALIVGWIVGNVVKVALSHVALPGHPNRLHWDRSAFDALFHFGKFIFLSSMAGFLISNGDRAILGKFVSLAELAVYNIGFFLATVPLLLHRRLVEKVMIPLYANRPPADSAWNRRHLARARIGLTAGSFALALVLGLSGDWLVRMLYTGPYHLAGPIMVLISVASLPVIVTASYAGVLLAAGNSRAFTLLTVSLACLQTALVLWGVQAYGLAGAIFAPALATLLIYPVLLRAIRPYSAQDLRHDALFFALSLGFGLLVLAVNDTALPRVLAGLPG